MDLRHMRHFVAVAEELHFGKAAQRLNMAQPPLSQSIKRLEIELGIDLFDRSRRSVALTPAGKTFLHEARRTLLQAELARKMAQREATKVPEVHVSFIGPALYRFLPDVVVKFREKRPDVHVRLYERSTPDQFSGMMAGDFDVAFISPVLARPLECETLIVERAPVIAAVPANSALAQGDSVTLAALAEHTYIVPPSRYRTNDVGEALAVFKAAGCMPVATQESSQTNTTISLVGAGLGCSMVMASAALMQSRNVRFLPIADDIPRLPWELMMAWLPGQLTPPGKEFVQFAKAYIHDRPHLLDGEKLVI
jgi:DNA-binding transcriptional LysR family regulator